MPKRNIFYLIVLMVFWAHGVLGVELLDISGRQGVRAQAMGGAYRAVATGNDAILLNPAGLPFFRRFNLDVDYIYSGRDQFHWTGLSLTDSMTTSLAAGLDFRMGINSQNPGDLSYLSSFSLAYPVFDIFSLGATVKYGYLPALESEGAINRITGDLGLMLNFPFGLSLAAVGYNLIPVHSKRLPLSVGFGGAFHLGSRSSVAATPAAAYTGLTVAVDWLMRDLTSGKIEHQLSAGGEYYLLDMIPLRFGYTWSLLEQIHVLSAGLGLFFQVVEIDGLFQQDLTHPSHRNFGAAVRIFFP